MFGGCLLKGHAKVGIANNATLVSIPAMSWSQCMVSCRSPCRKSHCDGPTICHSNVYWQTAPTSFRQAQHQCPPVSWPCYMTQLLLLSIPAIAWQSKCGTQSATLLGKHSGHLALHHRRYVYVKVPVLAVVYATVTFSVNPHATATFIGNLRDGHNIKVPASLRLSQYLCVVSLVRTTSPLLPTPMKV